jgi:hypothetical protein
VTNVEGAGRNPGKPFSKSMAHWDNYCKTHACLITFVNNCYTEFHENPINGSVADP